MKMEKPQLEQDIDLIHYPQEVDPLASLNAEVKQVLSDRGDTEILGDNLEEEMHNISFNESQHRVVQQHKVSTLDDHASPAQFKEQVIVSDM